MAILRGAEAAPRLYLVHQVRGTELLFILRSAECRPWHWTRAGREATYPRMCTRVLARSPRHARPPISRNTEAGANCWGNAEFRRFPLPLGRAPLENDSVPLQAPPRRQGRSTRMAAAVGTGLLAAYGTPLSSNRCRIVPCSSVLTFAQLSRVLFLRSAARVAES